MHVSVVGVKQQYDALHGGVILENPVEVGIESWMPWGGRLWVNIYLLKCPDKLVLQCENFRPSAAMVVLNSMMKSAPTRFVVIVDPSRCMLAVSPKS